MSDPIQLPPLTPYTGWSNSGEQTPSRPRRKPTSATKQMVSSGDNPEPPESSTSVQEPDSPGHLVDLEA